MKHLLLIAAACLLLCGIEACSGCSTTPGGDNTSDGGDTATDSLSCTEPYDDTWLLPVRNVNWGRVRNKLLRDPQHDVAICNEHFAPGTGSGNQMALAFDEINRQLGTTLEYRYWQNGISHRRGSQLFPPNPPASLFDYVWTRADSLPPPNCGLDDPSRGFAMRFCPYRTAGNRVINFTIVAKAGNYRHSSNPNGVDYPKKHGLMHEFAHAFGMVHARNWATRDSAYISTMQGNLTYLSALDVAFLRSQYPAPISPDHRNYVASSLTRFNSRKGKFEDQNPDEFYIDEEGQLRDCTDGQMPRLFAAWFNTGNLNADSTQCGYNRFLFRKRNGRQEQVIKEWRMAPMPYLSQDQYRDRVNVRIANPAPLMNGEWDLVFQTNADSLLNELTMQDNEVSKRIRFNPGTSGCN